jgi:hypothetical protein
MVRLRGFRNLHDDGDAGRLRTHPRQCDVQVSAVAREDSEPGLKD